MFDWAVGATRLLQFSCALVLFGSALFSFYGSPSVSARAPARAGFRSLWGLAAGFGAAATLAWLAAEAASLTGTWSGIGTLIAETHFGRVAVLRAIVLAAAFMACIFVRSARALGSAVSVLGGIAVVSFAWTGHGAMNSGSAGLLHRGADVLHLLTASIWIGALAALTILIERLRHDRDGVHARQIAHALSRFSVIGPAVVALLTLTGLINAAYLIGLSRWPALFRTAYGLTLLGKLGLFVVMLGLAAINRWRLAPNLEAALDASASPRAPIASLRKSLLLESVLALLVIAVVAALGTLEPPVSAD